MDNVLFNSAIDPHKTSVYPTRAKVGNFERRGDFTVWYDGKRSRVAFFLKDAVGDETYRLCLHLEPVGAPPQEVLSSMRPTISFSSVHDGRFVVYCKVSFRPQKNASLWAPTESVLGTFLEYSKKDPKLMMTFECADGTVEAVTSIMCSRSPVIDAMMKMDCIEARTRRVKIVDFSAEVIEKMVEFCQSNYVKFTEGFATDLYRVSDKYDIQGLKKAAKKLILRNINAENVIQLFQFSRRFTFEELEEECLGYAVYNLKLINKSSKFVEVEADVLKEFWLAMHDFQEICDKGEPASKKAKVGPVID